MEEKSRNAPRVKYYVERKDGWVQAAVILMLLSAAFRLIGCWGLWDDPFFAATQIALPLVCNVLFILLLLLLGKPLFWATSLPVLLGVVFLIIRSFSFNWLHTVLGIMLYLLAAVLYTATAFGFIRTKWVLAPLFGLPLLYHIFVQDLAALRNGGETLSFSAGMQEMSILCVLLALLSTVFAMKKKGETKAAKTGKKPASAAEIPAAGKETGPAAPAAAKPAPAAANPAPAAANPAPAAASAAPAAAASSAKPAAAEESAEPESAPGETGK